MKNNNDENEWNAEKKMENEEDGERIVGQKASQITCNIDQNRISFAIQNVEATTKPRINCSNENALFFLLARTICAHETNGALDFCVENGVIDVEASLR